MNLEVSEGENTANRVSLVIAKESASLEKYKEIPLDQKDDHIELTLWINKAHKYLLKQIEDANTKELLECADNYVIENCSKKMKEKCVTLDYKDDKVKAIKIKYVDTVPIAASSYILRASFLFVATEFRNRKIICTDVPIVDIRIVKDKKKIFNAISNESDNIMDIGKLSK
ncbi:20487_t:CDS:2, partial [Gigaspora margarita]